MKIIISIAVAVFLNDLFASDLVIDFDRLDKDAGQGSPSTQGIVKGSKKEGLDLFEYYREKDRRESRASGGSSGRSTCFGINSNDKRQACLAQFDGRSTCFGINGNDERQACLAQFDGRSTCFGINGNDERQACLAQFD